MKDNDASGEREFVPFGPKPSADASRWFRIAAIVNSIMGAIFAVLLLRDYYSPDLITGNESFLLFSILGPWMMRASYFQTKKHLWTNRQKLEVFGQNWTNDSFDSLLVGTIKSSLVIAAFLLLLEIAGGTVLHNIETQSISWALRILNMISGH